MAVASPRLFLALCPFFPLRLSMYVSPCLSPRVFTHRSHRTLRLSSCTESVSHTTYAHVYTPTHTYICAHLNVHAYVYTYTCKAHPVFSLALCTILRSFLLLFIVLFLLPSRLFLSRAPSYYIRVSRSENSLVGPE